MILNSKQLEELEHLHDTVSEFDEEANLGGESEEFDEIAEGALAWRRGMLEKAVATVRKTDRPDLSSKDDLAVGSLVYDTINNRFARVKTSSKTQVELLYVSGGTGTLKGSAIQVDEGPAPMTAKPAKKGKAEPKAPKAPTSAKATAGKPAKKPEVKKSEPKKAEPKKKAVPAKKPAPAKKTVPVKKAPAKKPAPAKKAPAKKPTPAKKPAPKKKAPAKKPAPAKKAPAKKPAPAKKAPAKKPAPKAKSSAKKPANINAFIKQNYRKMSNKELAGITGLSEHTIRRKLGEWGLKRPTK